MRHGRPGRVLLVWNVISANVGWWTCVLGVTHGAVWLGPLAIALLVAIHLRLVGHARRELSTMAAAALIGYLADSALVLAGAFAFPPEAQWGAPSTIWMMALWVNFATTFNVALHWLVKRPRLAAVLGAIAGPLAYTTGGQLGALVLPDGPWVMSAWVALEYALATPLLLALAVRIGRWRRQPVPLEAAGEPA